MISRVFAELAWSKRSKYPKTVKPVFIKSFTKCAAQTHSVMMTIIMMRMVESEVCEMTRGMTMMMMTTMMTMTMMMMTMTKTVCVWLSEDKKISRSLQQKQQQSEKDDNDDENYN